MKFAIERQRKAAWLASAAIVTGVALGTASPASAQDSTVDGAEPLATTRMTAEMNEIVVTAQRRVEDLQEVPISADVLTFDDLQAQHVTNLEGLQLATPSLTVGDAGLIPNVNIRGIGLALISPAVTPGVALYRDGIFMQALLGNEPLFDMASVEVLRGPQGTFVGSNSTGGAIMFRSRDPDFTGINGYAQAWAGNYNEFGVQGAINLPATDKLAVRLAFNAARRDSFYKLTGDLPPSGQLGNPGNSNLMNVRIGVLWEPVEGLSILSKTAINDEKTDGPAHVMSPANRYYDGRPLAYELDYNAPGTKYDQRGFRQSLQMDYEFGSGIVARLLLGYNNVKSPLVDDQDSSSFPGSATVPPATQLFVDDASGETITQEFNLISPSGGKFEWTVGAFHFYDKSIADLDLSSPTPPTAVILRAPNYRDSWAGFAHGSYQVTDALKLEAGLRYTTTSARNEGTITLIGLAPVPLVLPQDAEAEDDAWTGKVGLSWGINPDHHLYAFAAKGYKSGGINGPTSPDFEPEKVFDYELGVKSEWLGGMIKTQINGFYMDYSNFQISTYVPPANGMGGGTGIANAGQSTIWGFEAQMQAQIDRFGLDIGVSNVNSKLGETLYIDDDNLPGFGNVPLGPQCPAGTPSNPPVCFDYGPVTQNLSGRPEPYAPKWFVNFAAYYAIPIGETAELTPRVDFTYKSGQYQSILTTEANFIPAHTVVNASLTYSADDWRIEAYVTNLTKEIYITGVTYGPSLYLGKPQQYGLRVTRNF